jgi:cbb3-type cytochrome oxidase subunit 3
MEMLTGVMAAFGLSASAGLNAYIPLLVISLTARYTDLIQLNSPWDAITSWWIIGLLIFLSLIEFFADKVPAINHINDAIQTFVRPVAGAIVFAASANVITDMHPVLALAAGVLVSGTVHVVKSAAVRPAVTATTGGAGNVPVSVAEDVFATFLSIIAIIIPIFIAFVFILFTALVVWLFWRRNKKGKQIEQTA